MAMPTFLDVLKLNNDSGIVSLFDITVKGHPEIDFAFTDTIPGQSYVTVARTTVPTVGFRNGNEGQTPVKSVYENRLVETFILDASLEVDKAVASRYLKGAAAFIAQEQQGILEGAFRALGSQLFYGRNTRSVYAASGTTPAKGFLGLMDCYDQTNNEVDATGSTGSTGSSVWLVAWGQDKVKLVIGQDGALSFEDPYVCRLTDTNSKPYDGWRAPLLAFVGLQTVNPNSMVRIRDLTADSGKGLTDALLYTALDKFPAGISPTAIYMSRRSRAQLRTSRTATSPTGAPVANPSEWEGIPVYVTDSIVNTEELV